MELCKRRNTSKKSATLHGGNSQCSLSKCLTHVLAIFIVRSDIWPKIPADTAGCIEVVSGRRRSAGAKRWAALGVAGGGATPGAGEGGSAGRAAAGLEREHDRRRCARTSFQSASHTHTHATRRYNHFEVISSRIQKIKTAYGGEGFCHVKASHTLFLWLV